MAAHNRIKNALGILACIALATAAAQADQRVYPNGRGEIVRPAPEPAMAGTLLVNGRVFHIRHNNFKQQIIDAFRIMGYHAWRDNGRVYVNFDNRPPSASWYGDTYTIRITRNGDSLVLRPRSAHRVYPSRRPPLRQRPAIHHRPLRPAPHHGHHGYHGINPGWPAGIAVSVGLGSGWNW